MTELEQKANEYMTSKGHFFYDNKKVKVRNPEMKQAYIDGYEQGQKEDKGFCESFCIKGGKIKQLEQEITELKAQLEQEKKLNEEIKVRFVKCNTCTDEMKDKCLMWSENLCEGERCSDWVDLVKLFMEEKNDRRRF